MTIHCFRALDPPWSYAPLSGEGAALHGGRWNRKGRKALYLATDELTAITEFNQSLIFSPLTLVKYTLISKSLANFRNNNALQQYNCMGIFTLPATEHDDLQEKNIHNYQWKQSTDLGKPVLTQLVAEELITQNYDGLIFPSNTRKTGDCIVLWTWNEGDTTLAIEDPTNKLPHDQNS